MEPAVSAYDLILSLSPGAARWRGTASAGCAPQSLEDLAHHLMANVASLYSYNGLVRSTRLQSVHTAEKYLRHLEEAFLFFSLRLFSFKARDRATSDRKIYAIDNGLITATGFRSSPDRGKLYENLMEGLHVTQLIQVCRSLENPKTKTREARALPKAARELGCADLLVLTDSDEGEKRAS